MGTKLLDLEVFVEGQDFTFKSPQPTAFWLGKIMLVDKELKPEQLIMESVIGTPMFEVAVEKEPQVDETYEAMMADIGGKPVEKEETVEPTEVDNQSTGDSRISETSEPESIEGLPEQPTGGEPSKRSKKPRKRKAA
jgi:hypothetical protein